MDVPIGDLGFPSGDASSNNDRRPQWTMQGRCPGERTRPVTSTSRSSAIYLAMLTISPSRPARLARHNRARIQRPKRDVVVYWQGLISAAPRSHPVGSF
jgi:hypothetical protein